MEKKKLTYRKNQGFSIPKNYFEDLENRVMNAVASTNEAEEDISIEKEQVFTTPQGYFDKFEEKILAKTVFAEKKEVKVIPFYKKRSFYYAAASIAAIFILFLGIFNFENQTTSATMDSVELSSMETYIDEGYIDFSATEIATFFEEGNYETEMDISGIENEDLYEYFNENLENTSIIIE